MAKISTIRTEKLVRKFQEAETDEEFEVVNKDLEQLKKEADVKIKW